MKRQAIKPLKLKMRHKAKGIEAYFLKSETTPKMGIAIRHEDGHDMGPLTLYCWFDKRQVRSIKKWVKEFK